MDELLRSNNNKSSFFLVAFAISFYVLNLSCCCSLNDEGVALLKFKERIINDPYKALSNWIDEVGVDSPCYWSGIECSAGNVVVVNLKDLCLSGTLAHDIANLVHVRYINLRNNSFSGIIPEEIAHLKVLEVLDLGYNNFSGRIPCNLGNNDSMTVLLLDNNEFLLDITSPDIYELQRLSEAQVDEALLSNVQVTSWDSQDIPQRKMLQAAPSQRKRGRKFTPPPFIGHIPHSPRPQPPLSPTAPKKAPSPKPVSAPKPAHVSDKPISAPGPAQVSDPPRAQTLSREPSPPPSSASPSSLPVPEENSRVPVKSSRTRHNKLIMSAAIGGPMLLLLLVVGTFLYRSGKVSTVKPWASGLSGQLQRAFVAGAPKLKRSELEAACEDFSNVIDSSSICTIYKGTLSSGVEIAVASIAMNSSKDWSSNWESKFRKKIDTLSKVNHKNFVNLLGFCEEEKPFARMLVFEYAPNGTLFEHLHIREAEHLDWTMRLRIAMGMAYCLEHIHKLSPPLIHRNLTSSSVYLTEDYASKISDIVFWDEEDKKHTRESNVYSFGVILFEIMTGKLPHSIAGSSDRFEDWALDYLRGEQPLRDVVDPMLRSYREDQLQQIHDVIKSCVDPNPRQRPSMEEVCAKLRSITGITPNGAIPKLSPLWWAELEILSTEGS